MKSIKFPLILSLLLLACFSCKKENVVSKQTIVDNHIYEINPVVVYQDNIEKTRQKTSELFISGTYANLFQVPIDAGTLADLTQIRTATGDKQMVDELVLNNFINTGNAVIPTDQQMRANIEQFIADTYLRFFLRLANPYEVLELKKEIEADPGLTPDLIYQAFALSNEYKFY